MLLPLTAKNVVLKLLGFGSVLALGKSLRPGLYPSAPPILATATILTSVGAVADLVIVPKLGNLPSLMLGFPGMTSIIWGTAKLWPRTNVSLAQAATLALMAAPIEYTLHKMVLQDIGRQSAGHR